MKRLVIFLLGCMYLTSSFGQWVSGGTKISTGTAQNHRPMITPTKSGDTYITWVATPSEYQGTYGDIYLIGLDASGNILPGWYAGGIALTHYPDNYAPAVICSEDDGVIIAWHGAQSENDNLRIFAQKYSKSGTPLWNKGNPIIIAYATGHQDEYPVLASDKHNGFYVSWNRFNEFIDFRSEDIYLQHIDSTGNVAQGWSIDGVAAAASVDIPEYYSRLVVANNANSVYVMFSRGGIGKTALYIKKFNAADGSVDIDWGPSGYILSPGPYVWADISKEQFIFCDKDDNIITFWLEGRFTGNGEIYMQNMTADGKKLFSGGGKYITGQSAVNNGISYVEITKDFDGNFLMVYNNYDNSYDVSALKIGSDGNPIWINNTVTSNSASAYPKVAADGNKGMFIFYRDMSGGPDLLKAIALDSLGHFYKNWSLPGANFGQIDLFPAGMIAMPNYDNIVTVTKPGQATVAWNRIDEKYNYSIYVCNLLSDGRNCVTPPSGVIESLENKQIDVYPNPFNTEFNIKILGIKFDNKNNKSDILLKMYDIAGKVVFEKKILSDNETTISAGFLNNGIYYYNLNQGNEILRKGLIVKL